MFAAFIAVGNKNVWKGKQTSAAQFFTAVVATSKIQMYKVVAVDSLGRRASGVLYIVVKQGSQPCMYPHVFVFHDSIYVSIIIMICSIRSLMNDVVN